MARFVALVQARMGSSRLPGKTLAPLWEGRTVLGMLLERLAASRALDQVVVATSDAPADEPVAKSASDSFRGDEKDVLGRFAAAARRYPADFYVRVCADSPLTDPARIDELAEAAAPGVDYAFNHLPECGFPDGVGGELLSAALLERLARECGLPDEREHVTAAVHKDRSRFGVVRLSAPPALRRPELRLDVDYAQDLEFLRRLCAALGPRKGPRWSTEEIIAALDREPGLLALRRRREACS